ncbi:DUF4369 domain-containing protein [Aurantibacter sp.]|uniref:DUF4369 domain-containing protein n=1 Tax=Aurantibacter sp. TaxID=2807103 RepID=UPI003267C258
MRKFLVLFCIAIVIISCQEESKKETMTVSGNIKGLKKGVLYLQHLNDTILTTVDSLEISGDGNYSLKAELESPEFYYLYLNKKDNNDINDRITFFAEPGAITINTSWNTFDTNATIEGSATQKKWEEYQETMSQFNKKDLEILQYANNSELELSTTEVDSLIKLNEKNVLRSYLYALNFALNNTDSYIAPYIALNEVADANKIYLDSIANSLTPNVADSKYGKALSKHLESLDKK